MLTINNLSVSYGNKVVLSKLSFHADHQMIHGVVGYNGAGKTTLLNAIYSIPRKFEEIKMDGTILGRSSVSYLDSGQYFYPYISGRDYLKMFSARNPGFEYESLCRLFNVPIDNFVDTYSDGMKKKLAIVATLALKKVVIMMDEPFVCTDNTIEASYPSFCPGDHIICLYVAGKQESCNSTYSCVKIQAQSQGPYRIRLHQPVRLHLRRTAGRRGNSCRISV